MTKRECAIVMAYTGMCMLTGDSLKDYYAYIEEIIGRPVYTHELADKEMQRIIRQKSLNDFVELCRTAQ